MQDGYTQVGAGDSDMRIAGKDLQHHRQPREGRELHEPVRIITQYREAGGPMKEHMEHEMHHGHHDHKRSGHEMRHHLEMEKERHEEAMEHHKKHLERHHGRRYDSHHSY